jgi:hypothetical protein
MRLLASHRLSTYRPGSGRASVLATLALILCSALLSSAQDKKKPRLVLQITVDQLRGDLPHRYYSEFGEGGFRYLYGKGVVYEAAFHRHANTETIVGHTTLSTGADPSTHGMVGNVWLDRETGTLTYNVEDARYPLLTKGAGVNKESEVDPTQRLATTKGRSPASQRDRKNPASAKQIEALTGGLQESDYPYFELASRQQIKKTPSLVFFHAASSLLARSNQGVLDTLEQFMITKWLCKKIDRARLHCPRAHRDVAVASDKNELFFTAALNQCSLQIHPVHSRHMHVHDYARRTAV